jgi:hypothetical protein
MAARVFSSSSGLGSLLDDLLIAPLDRAFALEQVDDIAVLVAQHLDLDVARALDELLDEDPVVAEAGLGLGADGREALLDVLAMPGDADALAAAAGRGLDHHRIADLLGDLHGMRGVVDLADVAGHARDARGLGELLALDLVAHGSMAPGLGPMKTIPSSAQRCAKPAFSDRKPKPGCTASAPVCPQAAMILSATR